MGATRTLADTADTFSIVMKTSCAATYRHGCAALCLDPWESGIRRSQQPREYFALKQHYKALPDLRWRATSIRFLFFGLMTRHICSRLILRVRWVATSRSVCSSNTTIARTPTTCYHE